MRRVFLKQSLIASTTQTPRSQKVFDAVALAAAIGSAIPWGSFSTPAKATKDLFATKTKEAGDNNQVGTTCRLDSRGLRLLLTYPKLTTNEHLLLVVLCKVSSLLV